LNQDQNPSYGGFGQAQNSGFGQNNGNGRFGGNGRRGSDQFGQGGNGNSENNGTLGGVY
jgi:hypothetical protein